MVHHIYIRMYSVSVSMYKCDTVLVCVYVHLWVWLVCRWVCLMWLCAVMGTSVTKDLRARVVANTIILFLFILQETEGAGCDPIHRNSHSILWWQLGTDYVCNVMCQLLIIIVVTFCTFRFLDTFILYCPLFSCTILLLVYII